MSMYMHRFCKVVTSGIHEAEATAQCICIDFVRLLHRKDKGGERRPECICIDFVRLLHPD